MTPQKKIVFFIGAFILLTSVKLMDISIELSWCIDKNNAETIYKNKSLREGEKNVSRFYQDEKQIVYFKQNGDILFRGLKEKEALYSLCPDKPVYIKYKSYGHEIVVFQQGEQIRKIRTAAYPFISHDGKSILLITGEAEGFFIYTLTNNLISPSVYMGAPVIDVQQGWHNFYMGTLDGLFYKIEPTPFNLKKRYNDFSGINIIKKICVSDDESLVSYLSGSYPEYIVLLKNGKVTKIRTKENKKKKTDLSLSKDKWRLSEETETGFNIYSTSPLSRIISITNGVLFNGKKLFKLGFLKKETFLTTFNKGEISYAILFEGKQIKWINQYHSKQIRQDIINNNTILIEDDRSIYCYKFEGW